MPIIAASRRGVYQCAVQAARAFNVEDVGGQSVPDRRENLTSSFSPSHHAERQIDPCAGPLLFRRLLQAMDIEFLRPGRHDNKAAARNTVTSEQFWSLSKELSEPYRTMVLLAVLSGMSCGEIFGLRWRYVDFEDDALVVAETVYQGHSSQPKTRASNRKVVVVGQGSVGLSKSAC
jgi:hypothetical protein